MKLQYYRLIRKKRVAFTNFSSLEIKNKYLLNESILMTEKKYL